MPLALPEMHEGVKGAHSLSTPLGNTINDLASGAEAVLSV